MQQLKFEVVERYLPIAINIVTKTKIDSSLIASLSQGEKVVISKIVKNLNYLCKLNKKEVVDIVKSNPAYQTVLAQLFFDHSINNWRVLTGDPQPHPNIVIKACESEECVGIDYRLEFTMSTIGKKKVMKPVVALIFTMKKGKLQVYLNIEQFSKLRYKVANALKSVYSIQMKTLF